MSRSSRRIWAVFENHMLDLKPLHLQSFVGHWIGGYNNKDCTKGWMQNRCQTGFDFHCRLIMRHQGNIHCSQPCLIWDMYMFDTHFSLMTTEARFEQHDGKSTPQHIFWLLIIYEQQLQDESIRYWYRFYVSDWKFTCIPETLVLRRLITGLVSVWETMYLFRAPASMEQCHLPQTRTIHAGLPRFENYESFV